MSEGTSPSAQPRLVGPDVALRPFCDDDSPVVERLASAREIADMTLRIPHPYPEGAAAAWIATHRPAWEAGNQAHFAITTDGDRLVGAMSLIIAQEQRWAEIGYWVGVPYWNKGYCTTAGRLVVRFAFEDLGLHRIQAHCLVRNPASSRVLEKLGMKHEGLHRDAVRKWERFEDVAAYAILAPEWEHSGK